MTNIEKENSEETVVIIEVSGGAVQQVSSNSNVRVLILDADIDEENTHNTLINNDMVLVSEHLTESNKEYCNAILEQIKST